MLRSTEIVNSRRAKFTQIGTICSVVHGRRQSQCSGSLSLAQSQGTSDCEKCTAGTSAMPNVYNVLLCRVIITLIGQFELELPVETQQNATRRSISDVCDQSAAGRWNRWIIWVWMSNILAVLIDLIPVSFAFWWTWREANTDGSAASTIGRHTSTEDRDFPLTSSWR